MRAGRPIKSYVRITQRFAPPAHYGLDLSAYVGTPVYASVEGTAYVANQPEGFGLYVRLETPEYKVYTAHLNAVAVQSGQVVPRGQIIGYSGNTGNSTGPHLHFEIRRNAGSPFKYGAIDPWPLIDWEPAPPERRIIGVHLGAGCPLSEGDRRVIDLLRPGCVVFLPSYGIDRQEIGPAEIAWILSLVPDCHIFLRPYIPPEMASTDAGCRAYIDAVLEILPPWASLVPSGQLHLQLWNEPNAPRGVGWEGFGTQEADMRRLDALFCEAYRRIKERFPSVKIGWPPLTIGNRDCWFQGDPVGMYYLHGPTGCQPPESLTSAQWETARREGPCFASLTLADELYAHLYIHDQDNLVDCWKNAAYGLRFERMRYWWPEKPMWITEYGFPDRFYVEAPGASQRLISHVTYLQRQAPYVGGAALWTLGNNARWGGEMYHREGTPIPLVRELAALQREDLPPPMSEEEISAWLAGFIQGYILPLNPDAALYKAAKARNPNLTVASDEVRPHELGIPLPPGFPEDIVCQAFRNPLDETWQEIAWTRIGEWDPKQIRWVRRRN